MLQDADMHMHIHIHTHMHMQTAADSLLSPCPPASFMHYLVFVPTSVNLVSPLASFRSRCLRPPSPPCNLQAAASAGEWQRPACGASSREMQGSQDGILLHPTPIAGPSRPQLCGRSGYDTWQASSSALGQAAQSTAHLSFVTSGP